MKQVHKGGLIVFLILVSLSLLLFKMFGNYVMNRSAADKRRRYRILNSIRRNRRFGSRRRLR